MFMLFYPLICFMFLLINNPIIMSILLMMMTFILFFSFYYMKLSFYGYLIMLLILSGLCVMFYYISCMSGNEDEIFFYNFFFFFFIMIILFINLYMNYNNMMEGYSFKNYYTNLRFIYMINSGFLSSFLINYLLCCLLVVVKITKLSSNKPLCSSYK